VGFSLHQFSDVFRIRDAAGEPYILIGGQAVNYWAERYLPTEPELKALHPFTSQDIDFKGNLDDVQRIAKQLESSPNYPPRVAMTALAGMVPIQIGNQKSVIEVVRQIPGVSSAAQTPPVQAQWEQQTIRVLDPVSLLACKLELAATVPQAKRQDVTHLKILLPCVRSFLGELLHQVETGQLQARDWLKVANQILKLSTSLRAQKIADRFQIDWSGVLPLAAIARSKDEKIRRFQKQQLQRGYKKSGGISI